MGVVLEFGLVLVLIGMALSYLFRGRAVAAKQAITDRRVEAYIETIRRERSNPELTAMSDTELRDLLLSSAHNLKVQRDRRMYLLFGGVVVKVPPEWSVVLRGTPVLGGFEDKTTPSRTAAHRLVIDGSVIMGGIEIKN